MEYRSITTQQLVQYFRNLNHKTELYSLTQILTQDEFAILLLAASDESKAVQQLENNPTDFQSIVDKLYQLDLSITHRASESFDSLLQKAQQIIFSPSARFCKQVHDYEREHQLLLSDLSEQQARDFVKSNPQRSTVTIYQKVLLPLTNYVEQLWNEGLTSVRPNVMSGIDYKTIDFSEKLKEVSFASEEDLTNFLLVVAPRIEDNVATNRLLMMCLLCYAGVEPGDLLGLKDSALHDNCLDYQGKTIPVSPVVTQISDLWAKRHKYNLRTDSVTEIPLLETDLLIKTHTETTIPAYGQALRNMLQRSRTDKMDVTFRDIYAAGEYRRFLESGDFNGTDQRRMMFENDVLNWVRAFQIPLTDEQKNRFIKQKVN